MNIYCVRHGQTNWNIEKKFQGRKDIELNETGINQAYQTAELSKSYNFDLIISSPLSRALKTAQIINENHNKEIIIENDLIERSFGNMEGKQNSDDLNITMMLDYNSNISCENIEPIQDLFKRVYKTLDNIIDKYKNKNILLVTHAGVLQAVECYFNGEPELINAASLQKIVFNNCEIRKYEVKKKKKGNKKDEENLNLL